MSETRIVLADLSRAIESGKTVKFKWRTRIGEMMTSVSPDEWAEWDEDRRQAFYSDMQLYGAVAWT